MSNLRKLREKIYEIHIIIYKKSPRTNKKLHAIKKCRKTWEKLINEHNVLPPNEANQFKAITNHVNANEFRKLIVVNVLRSNLEPSSSFSTRTTNIKSY